jgi:uncharacterized protein
MKNRMKTRTPHTLWHRILVSLALITAPCLSSQAQYAVDELTKKAVEAINLTLGTTGKVDAKAAYETLLSGAGLGHPMSMNAVGKLLMEGIGCTANPEEGIKWLEKAGEAKYYGAWHNLGVIYKYGRGVKQDFEIAFYYFDKLARQSCEMQRLGCYDAGFMLYKGLGCTQNYQKAFEYFKIGAESGFPPCMYMLALCYRNGYGTLQDMGRGGYWLSQSIKEGYTPAIEEYYAGGPERTPSRAMVSARDGQGSLMAAPEQMPTMPHMSSIPENALDGTYQGMLITYDWSGKSVIRETPLTLDIKTNSEGILAEWKEEGLDTITIKARWEAQGLVFTDAKQGRRGHYDARGNVLWQFTQAQLQLLQEDTAAYIVGNLQMYSPQTMEPNQPMYLNLKKAGVTPHSPTKSRFYVYPNPFSEGINVSFFQQKEEKVSIQISTVNGKAVYQADLGKYPQGQQDITLTLNLQPGAYILRLTTGKTTQQSVIIRK